MFRSRARLVTGMIGALLLIAGAALLYAFYGGNAFPRSAEEVLFVSKGETFLAVTDTLEERGMIRSRWLFELVARLLGGTDRIQIGKYRFATGVSNQELFLTLRSGRGNALIFVSIPEGLRTRAQARLFARALGLDSTRFVALTRDREFITSVGIRDTTLEGYLLPDTYGFSWQQDEREVVARLVAQFERFYDDSLREREEEIGWTTGQVLALASIIEGEAVREDERATISGVYWNRLRKGMKLEADPTIQYILNGRPRRLAYRDLKIDHPYNTYRRVGLPPGPVNNPGRASIVAALYPESHRYLFFVADGKGGHRFAATYAEHLKNVRAYRRAREVASRS
jgi:UPF0755 protein